MPDADDPPWQYLPHHPERFFGLAKGYSRKDLKRSYNRLLRRFKPDRNPAEFKRLRAAYERLDARFEYASDDASGALGSGAVLFGDDFTEDANGRGDELLATGRPAPSTPAQPEPHSRETEAQRLIGRLSSAAPKKVYTELAKRASKSPFDFYALALISELIHAADEMTFYRWLLSGLKEHRGNAALIELLRNYLRTDEVPIDRLPSILLAVSRVVSTDQFYRVAETPLERILVHAGWEPFQKVLKACQENIRDHQIHVRIHFTCRLLRKIVWLAPTKAAQEMIDYVDQHSELLGFTLEHEVELVSRLMLYVAGRRRLIAEGPLSRQIDEAMRQYCLENNAKTVEKMVACQVQITRQPEALFAEFGLEHGTEPSNWLAWLLISEEVEGQLATPSVKMVTEEFYQPTLALLSQLDRVSPTVKFQMLVVVKWGMIAFASLVILAGVVFASGMLHLWFPASAAHWVTLFSLLMAFGLIAACFAGAPKRRLDKWYAAAGERTARALYLRLWRPLIRRFFAATHIPYGNYCSAIGFVVQKQHATLGVSTWLPNICAHDTGMMIYAIAVRFLR